MQKYKSKYEKTFMHIYWLIATHTTTWAKEKYVSDLLQWHWNLSHSQKKSLYKIRFFLSFAFCHSLQLQLIYRHALNLSPHLFFCIIFVSLSRLQMNNKSDFICLYIYAMLSHTSNKWCLTSSSCGDFFFVLNANKFIIDWIVCGKCCWFDGDLGVEMCLLVSF